MVIFSSIHRIVLCGMYALRGAKLVNVFANVDLEKTSGVVRPGSQSYSRDI